MRFALTCSIVMLVASPALAFEGLLEASLSSEQGVAAEVSARYSKAGDVRMDVTSKDAEGQPVLMTTVMPATGSVYYSIQHAQRIIVEVPYSKLVDTSHQVSGSGDNANLEIKKLGRATVSGVPTEHVRVIDKDNDAVIDLWLTQKYPADLWTRAFRGRNLGLEISDDERTKAMKKYGVKPGFSMKMRVKRTGGVPVVFLVKKIERVPVPAEVFSLPDGYKRVRAQSGSQP
jgi:hypothetical protein